MKLHLDKKPWIAALVGVIVAFTSLPISTVAQNGSRIEGVWVTSEGEGRVKISQCEDGKYCGQLIWTENKAKGKPLQKDVNNPDADKRDRTVLGIRLLKGLTYDADDDQWEDGEIYDPNKGKTYNCYAELKNPDKLKLRGYVGVSMFGRTTYWKRYKGNSED